MMMKKKPALSWRERGREGGRREREREREGGRKGGRQKYEKTQGIKEKVTVVELGGQREMKKKVEKR